MVGFDVLGTPKPQGSKKAFNANGRAQLKEAGGLGHAAWRNAVADASRTAAGDRAPMTGALSVTLSFRFPMPASRRKADRVRGLMLKVTAPDLDKLERCVLDGMQAGGLIGNDALVAHLDSCKYEIDPGRPGYWIGVRVQVLRVELHEVAAL